MAAEWRDVTLADLVAIQRGHDLTEDQRRPGRIPVLGSAGQNGCHDTALAPGPGVVIGRSGASFGQVNYCPVAYWPHNTVLYVTDFHGNDPRYVYYCLKSLDFSRYDSGSAQQSLNRNYIYSVSVRLPDIQSQRAIAHILGTLDDKIELNRRMNETLEAMARAIFKSWFLDFDPVRAKAEDRDPGLPKPLADLFPESFEDSEMGEMPKAWPVRTLGDVAEHLRDQENPLASPDVFFHHFSIPAFDEGQSPKTELGESIKSLKLRVAPGVILLSKLNPDIERVWLVDVESAHRAVCSTEFLVLHPKSPFGRAYIYCLTRSPLFRQQIEALVTGTSGSHQRAQVDAILRLPAILPPAHIVAAFERTMAPLLNRRLGCRRESRTLAALRDALLPKLVSGEIRVKEAERLLEKRV